MTLGSSRFVSLQGAGILIEHGMATLTDTNVYENEAISVCLCLLNLA